MQLKEIIKRAKEGPAGSLVERSLEDKLNKLTLLHTQAAAQANPASDTEVAVDQKVVTATIARAKKAAKAAVEMISICSAQA